MFGQKIIFFSFSFRKLLESTTVVNVVLPSANNLVWVATNNGHLFGLSSTTFQVLTSVKEHTRIDSLVEMKDFLIVFGEWRYESVSEHKQDVVRGFSVWKAHHCNYTPSLI